MENGFQFFDILLFAAIAGFLLLRLWSVLGRRTGNERRRPDPFAPPPKPMPMPPNQGPAAAPTPFQPRLIPANGNSAALKAADASFDEEAFLKGARGAFEIVVAAFAAGDTAKLQPLLSKDVFGAFADAIRARQAAKETMETKLVAIKSAEVVETRTEGATGLVTVKIISDQINVTRDAAGQVLEGHPDTAIEKTDFWTFSRPLRARDPNWTLVATHSP